MTELAGRLSEQVRFEGRDEVRGPAGALTSEWVLRFARWARVEVLPRTDNSVQGGETRHGRRRLRLTLRSGVQPTLDMRIRWRGEILAVTGIDSDVRGGRLTVWAEDTTG